MSACRGSHRPRRAMGRGYAQHVVREHDDLAGVPKRGVGKARVHTTAVRVWERLVYDTLHLRSCSVSGIHVPNDKKDKREERGGTTRR